MHLSMGFGRRVFANDDHISRLDRGDDMWRQCTKYVQYHNNTSMSLSFVVIHSSS